MSPVPMPRFRAYTLLLVAGGLLTAAAACFSEHSAPTSPSTGGECSIPITPDLLGATIVVVRDFSFQPASVTVKQGATVVWANCSDPNDPPHTSTADAGGWNSPTIAPGETFAQTFDQAGSFAYHCEPHPFMTGTVVVAP
jgi:plastocyanin